MELFKGCPSVRWPWPAAQLMSDMFDNDGIFKCGPGGKARRHQSSGN